MVEVKTSDLEGAALDWAVAIVVFEGDEDGCIASLKINGFEIINPSYESFFEFKPSTDWSQGGPLIEKYRVDLQAPTHSAKPWVAYACGDFYDGIYDVFTLEADTPLIAACRAIVSAELGDVVSVPAELLKDS